MRRVLLPFASIFRGYLESIQQKYSSIIEIDFKLFDSIKLTHIDLYAYKKVLPYPSIVPSFPILTTNHEINYGVELNNLP